MPGTDPREELVLVLAPTGRDARLIAGELERHGLTSLVCDSIEGLCAEIAVGAGTALVAEEALPPRDLRALVETLGRQPPWSDLPLLVLTGKGTPSIASVQRFETLEPVANVTQLERPVHARTLLSAVRATLRARRRQYDVRGHMEERERLVEQLRDADHRKDDFLALLAHELRNPLAPIRNGLQVIRLSPDRDARERSQAMMDRQLSHMVRLIDDLLDVSRISRNKMELRRARLLLSDVVSSAVETVRPAVDSAGHELTVSLPEEPIYLDADLTRLAQVFGNLLGNSTKYTRPGGRIRLSANADADHVTVTVTDNGIGIPAESLPTIFDMFSQVDRSIERSTGGLGIGLALVKGLVEMHGGTVTAASEGPDRGSSFTVRLPRLRPSPASVAPDRNGAASGGGAGRRVLVVDDNRDSAESMAEMLKLLGYSVALAHDGFEAVEEAERVRPNVVLMDVGMPRMNGLDATRRIRERPWGRDAVIVALTGWGQEGDKARSKDAGCNGHLVKPVSLSDLEKLLGELK